MRELYVRSMETVEGGFSLNDLQFILNSEGEENLYKVSLGTGTYQLAVFYVDARNEQNAVDRVVDFCEDNELKGLYQEYGELVDEAESEGVDINLENGVDNYIEGLGLIASGNASHYIDLQGLVLVKEEV